MIASFHQHLAVHHRPLDPLGELFAALGAAWQVLCHARFQRADGRGIEYHQVGGHARAHEPAVGKSEERCRHESKLSDGVLQRHDFFLAHPVRQQVSRVAIVGAKNHVGAAVRLADNGVRAGEQCGHGGLVAVDFAPFELGFQIFFQGQVEEGIEHVFVLFPRDIGHALAFEVLIFRQRRLEDELQIPAAREVAGAIGIDRASRRLQCAVWRGSPGRGTLPCVVRAGSSMTFFQVAMASKCCAVFSV